MSPCFQRPPPLWKSMKLYCCSHTPICQRGSKCYFRPGLGVDICDIMFQQVSLLCILILVFPDVPQCWPHFDIRVIQPPFVQHSPPILNCSFLQLVSCDHNICRVCQLYCQFKTSKIQRLLSPAIVLPYMHCQCFVIHWVVKTVNCHQTASFVCYVSSASKWRGDRTTKEEVESLQVFWWSELHTE